VDRFNDETLERAREIYRAAKLLQLWLTRRFEEVAKAGAQSGVCTELTFPQFNTLIVVRDATELSIKELAERLHVSPPSASSMVDRMVDMGMLAREHSRQDRREVRVRLAEAGEATLVAVEDEVLQGIGELLEAMGEKGAATWCSVYRRITELLTEHPGEACPGAGKDGTE